MKSLCGYCASFLALHGHVIAVAALVLGPALVLARLATLLVATCAYEKHSTISPMTAVMNHPRSGTLLARSPGLPPRCAGQFRSDDASIDILVTTDNSPTATATALLCTNGLPHGGQICEMDLGHESDKLLSPLFVLTVCNHQLRRNHAKHSSAPLLSP